MNVPVRSVSNGMVVLGASNVSRGLSRLVATVRARTSGSDAAAPFELFVAAGHGRSYGVNSRVWMRRLPAILRCGLWRGLDRRGFVADAPPPGRLHALVTDVGNDLLYGFPPGQVAGWVREAVARLAARGAAIAITRLPMASIAGVGALRYRLLRTLYVPGCPLDLDDLKRAADALDLGLVEIANEHGAVVVEQPGDWYGLDAMHPRRRHLGELWDRACDAWRLAPAEGVPRASSREWALLGSRAAEVRSLAGSMLFTPQPAVRLADAVPVSLF
ncbi:MAG: hypothetical protein EBZ59_03715 [Planctomycetia bacterium]|nr:hypothetical protein [Planctomycetia bacterium]